MGPEGGNGGGRVIAQGTPEQVVLVEDSYTGQFLAPVLARNGRTPSITAGVKVRPTPAMALAVAKIAVSKSAVKKTAAKKAAVRKAAVRKAPAKTAGKKSAAKKL